MALFFTAYSLWVVFAKLLTGVWIYAHLRGFTWWMVALENLGFIFVLWMIYLVTDFFNNLVWRRSSKVGVEEMIKFQNGFTNLNTV